MGGGGGLEDVEAIAYHEGIPGHHLQISIAQELTGLPEFRKHSGYTAFTEGWALYSERLGKEVGFYQDPVNDYGRLEADVWRAIRLVVDTGVHSEHWTRQQMLDYFHAHSTMDDTNIIAETDRYIAWPGQALGYKMGQLKILELRAKAKAALGDKFNLKAFHDVVVDSGALPMDVLEERVDGWGGGDEEVGPPPRPRLHLDWYQATPFMDLLAKIRTIPTQPGCYLYKNAAGEVIYVGKAKNLRARGALVLFGGESEE